MATLAQLQQNPLFNRQQARNAAGANQNALNALHMNPLNFLSNTPVTCSAGAGHVTALNPNCGFSLNQAGTELKIGIIVNAATYPNRILVPIIESPTRGSTGAHLANRYAAAQRFAGGGAAQLWITDQQTGCTVIALDWGGNQYSMFHLLPYENADFGRMARAAFAVSSFARSGIKNTSLRTDATQVVNASLAGGAQPQRYIMLQSQHNARRAQYMQSIGVNRNGGWEFYRQLQGRNATGFTVISAALAPWRPWNECFYHDL
jgi:hypothetical protein